MIKIGGVDPFEWNKIEVCGAFWPKTENSEYWRDTLYVISQRWRHIRLFPSSSRRCALSWQWKNDVTQPVFSDAYQTAQLMKTHQFYYFYELSKLSLSTWNLISEKISLKWTEQMKHARRALMDCKNKWSWYSHLVDSFGALSSRLGLFAQPTTARYSLYSENEQMLVHRKSPRKTNKHA